MLRISCAESDVIPCSSCAPAEHWRRHELDVKPGRQHRHCAALVSLPLGAVDARQDVEQCSIRQVSQAQTLCVRDGASDGRCPARQKGPHTCGGHGGARKRMPSLDGRLAVLDHGLQQHGQGRWQQIWQGGVGSWAAEAAVSGRGGLLASDQPSQGSGIALEKLQGERSGAQRCAAGLSPSWL